MLLAGAHDSRVVNRRARGAETGRPRASRGLCRAWGSLLQGLPPNPWPARTRWEQNRRDTSHAHGLVGLRMPPLVDFCCANHAPQKKKSKPRPSITACARAYRPCQAQDSLYAVEIQPVTAGQESARVTTPATLITRRVLKCPFSPRTRRWLPWKKPRPGSRTCR